MFFWDNWKSEGVSLSRAKVTRSLGRRCLALPSDGDSLSRAKVTRSLGRR